MAPAVKRVYAEPAASDGLRVLVDRLWPRGLSKESAKIDVWMKDIAPSDELRRRFHGRPDQWTDFKTAYARELAAEPAVSLARALIERIKAGPTTLLFAARDEEHNNAIALRDWLRRRMR